MVKCKDGAYICFEQHLEIVADLNEEIEFRVRGKMDELIANAAAIAAENERLRKRVADLLKQVSAVRNLTDEERSDAR